MNHPANKKDSKLQLPRDSSVPYSEGRGSEKRPYDELPELQSNFACLWWSPMASEALSYGLKLKIFLGEHTPRPPPPYNAVPGRPYTQKKMRAARAVWPHQSPCVAPLSSISGSAPGYSSSPLQLAPNEIIKCIRLKSVERKQYTQDLLIRDQL